MKYIIWICLCTILTQLASGQVAEISPRSDLEDALARLNQEREVISSEKTELLKKFNALEAQLREKRREVEGAERTILRSVDDLRERREKVVKQEERLRDLEQLINDYQASLETSIHPSHLGQLQAVTSDGSSSIAGRWTRLVDFSRQRVTESIGGEISPGVALMDSGEQQSGTFFLWGPAAYFVSDDKGIAGHAVPGDGLAPKIVPFQDEQTATELAAIVEGGDGILPLDASGGRALILAQQGQDPWTRIQDGGIWVWPILTLALLALVVFILKTVQISSVRLPGFRTLEPIFQALESRNIEEAKTQIDSLSKPAMELLKDGLARTEYPREALEDSLLEHIIRWQMRWERGLPVLAVTAAVSPLLGLLGTVTGMISTFRMIGVYGSGDARPLSGGIAEALITTELGLLVAIPALIAHAILSRKAQSLTAEMESLASRFVESLSIRDLDNPPSLLTDSKDTKSPNE
ncbi:MAG: MotA/TolQ/ExbB proton channel family protein [Verrucomicrobiota bacterium]